MKLKTIAIAILLPAFFAAESAAQDVARGYVYEDTDGDGKRDRKEKGIAGVAVSDGCNIVTTGADGSYELPVSDHCVIFAIKPKGYIPPVNEMQLPMNWYIHKPAGSPELEYPGSAPTGPLPKSLDFPMKACDDPEKFRFFAFGDPQPYSLKEVEYFRKEIVEEARHYDGISFGISLGDIVGDPLDIMPPYSEAISRIGIPWYNVIGNHNRNYDCKEEKFANETFEANFGPSDYAFRYGDTHFIVLDDIFMHLAPKANPYKGGFTPRQLQFLENYLKLVKKGELVVVSYHIPIAYKDGQFIDKDRREFFRILSGHNVLGLSAHTHIQMQFFYGSDLGWEGDKPYHEYNVGTTNGDWYSGRIDKNGLPDATMRDGTPQGYAIVNIDGGKYTFDYKVAGAPAEKQMTVYCAEGVPHKRGGKFPIYVNFYIGAPDDKVEFRTDGGEWKKMKRVTDEADPTFMNLVYEWDRAGAALKGRRPASVPTLCTHLWKSELDNRLAPGTHTIEVRATDMFGRTHTETHTYRIFE